MTGVLPQGEAAHGICFLGVGPIFYESMMPKSGGWPGVCAVMGACSHGAAVGTAGSRVAFQRGIGVDRLLILPTSIKLFRKYDFHVS